MERMPQKSCKRSPEGISMPETWNSSLAVSYDTVTNEIAFTPLVNVIDGIALACEHFGDLKNLPRPRRERQGSALQKSL